MPTFPLVVLPRPGTTIPEPASSIPAPSEAAFTSTFGTILPQASYLQTPAGQAAYYSIPPTTTTPGRGPTRILFVHGVQTSAIGMAPLARALAARFPAAHCVLFDHWGHGLSATPRQPHAPPLFHDLISAVLDHLRWPSAHFVGYSFGGATTATFAARFPERVESMVLVAPAGLLRAAQFTEQQRGLLKGGNGDEAVERRARDWILEWLEGGPLVVPADWEPRVARGEVVAQMVRKWQMEEHPGHAASVVGIFRDGGVMDMHDTFRVAAEKGIPARCVLGQLDDLCTVQELGELGFGDVHVVQGVGHGVVRERVSEVAGLVAEFWER
ncbi:alpha/beta fold hydrolase [Aspergillus brunneoviolaceus CBS 621.78]|uniref:Alpha/beta-hydrolase n=1 Tax=Aspergillus brunneoviolaceus CBS 621.78 TaxID=1450534 RepID=A0ACD1GN76_9EURO|nr:alpha/beta-hydrolase [Aspergillus brunneoviolaceus CBS 621.78]RAH50682.1 alpha/beta-hydrolase [Aspergillus brunneoviolaceus CBS 621.78]